MQFDRGFCCSDLVLNTVYCSSILTLSLPIISKSLTQLSTLVTRNWIADSRGSRVILLRIQVIFIEYIMYIVPRIRCIPTYYLVPINYIGNSCAYDVAKDRPRIFVQRRLGVG